MAIMMPVDIQSMSEEERLDIISQIWRTIANSDTRSPLTEDKLTELGRRLDNYRANPDRVFSQDEIDHDLDEICGD